MAAASDDGGTSWPGSAGAINASDGLPSPDRTRLYAATRHPSGCFNQ